jgi:hypothetical protein
MRMRPAAGGVKMAENARCVAPHLPGALACKRSIAFKIRCRVSLPTMSKAPLTARRIYLVDGPSRPDGSDVDASTAGGLVAALSTEFGMTLPQLMHSASAPPLARRRRNVLLSAIFTTERHCHSTLVGFARPTGVGFKHP